MSHGSSSDRGLYHKPFLPGTKQLGGVPYFKHGYGCAVKLPTGTIDFDFGKRGEIDGFDEWRLIRFAGLKLFEYGFPSEDSLKECFKAEVTAGSLVYSGHILYYITDAT
ncbi:DUF6896 domain-containing protein [Pseudomonas asuensis]|uniref:DUF6896 domain-containing protein n=1 Tax=Pseudomonas asuensis TaxID=1825787 RepID=A0ABQ2H4A9_9PSED|nr:hypothetical protein [Pseudomonas asuensis]GGM30190.1 hypothetical protein GCM10009425_45980 [Pseudomonas asuensis]